MRTALVRRRLILKRGRDRQRMCPLAAKGCGFGDGDQDHRTEQDEQANELAHTTPETAGTRAPLDQTDAFSP
ncbi:MAG: hypothetical protein Kow0013_15730 [Pararhodobacter sp.]